jgi:hypothetical protein
MGKHKLEFLNPVFKNGLNYTVRLGEKWYERLEIGDFVEIADTDKVAKITSVEVKDFYDIDYEGTVFANEHDPECRDVDGLERAMSRAYPNLDNLIDEAVTIIGFWVYKLIG